MAELVGIYAASHTPVMLNFPDAIPGEDRDAIFAAFKEMGRRIAESRPDTVIVISDDHVHNFFFNNFPAFCIGAAESYQTPVEHWLKAEKQVLPGNAALGAHLLGEALQNGFDPSFSIELVLDHGSLTPLLLAGLVPHVQIVPLLVNCVQPPLPTMRRCVDWGKFLRKAITRFDASKRIAILATGGISHDIATPRMGMVNEEFDRQFLANLGSGHTDTIVEHATNHVAAAGNGAEEIRNWLIGHGAADGAQFESLYYKAVSKWYTGIGLAQWKVKG
ncbi:2,3-dihydroxyphenylpropionate 1,2-dioxygenase [Herbaspirillum sp. C7C2]|uniref:DODA-type extradiol aromatic ring-opening family dioxygenase n=1 Tax=Herbaspirillum sp. C7C2 TaxID=2736666 RepID=UPI001F5196CB|nr:2,3-dihydroxyphenylpropionate 1,2-dioxygenase [Herbaspirillum sp. C7C2]MCI1016102.1 2,3-dihydroxyphenylpropionate 1,2-dioxygenase [Herbaspirillum sp. C7C2]